MCDLCEEYGGEGIGCQECGKDICWDAKPEDEWPARAVATVSGDLCCAACAAIHDAAEEEACDEDCGEIDFDGYDHYTLD